MKELEKNIGSVDGYIKKNREKLDEALVSLRLMKEVDDFLEVNTVNHRVFASKIGCSEAYVSQLMSGTKNMNVSFINKLEKAFEVKVEFKITTKDESVFLSKYSDLPIEININLFGIMDSNHAFSFDSKPSEFSEFDSDYEILEG